MADRGGCQRGHRFASRLQLGQKHDALGWSPIQVIRLSVRLTAAEDEDIPGHRRAKLLSLTGVGLQVLVTIQTALARWANDPGAEIGAEGLRRGERGPRYRARAVDTAGSGGPDRERAMTPVVVRHTPACRLRRRLDDREPDQRRFDGQHADLNPPDLHDLARVDANMGRVCRGLIGGEPESGGQPAGRRSTLGYVLLLDDVAGPDPQLAHDHLGARLDDELAFAGTKRGID
jgi:hypothetical protein